MADKRVCVSWVSNNNCLCVAGTVVVDGFANINKDLSVVLEKVSTLHSWATWLGTNQEVVVDILEGGAKIAGDDNLIEKREGAIMEFSLDTLEDLLLEGEIKQVKDDSLVLSEEFTTKEKIQVSWEKV